MRIYYISTLILFLYINTYSQDSLYAEKKFDIKSCKITYNLDIGIAKGEKTIVFDDWGSIAKEYGVIYPDSSQLQLLVGEDFSEAFDTLSMNKTLQVQHSLKIQRKEIIYNIDLDAKVGYISPLFKASSSFKMADSIEKIIGTDTFLNRLCIVKSFGDKVKFWYWNNLVLKKEFDEEGLVEILEYATSIDENYIIKPDEFEIPKDVTIK